MKLVWHIHNFNHEDWIRTLFGDLVTEEIVDLGFTCFEDDTIHVVSGILTPLASTEAYFAQCRRRCRNIVLFQGSDEWLSGGYRVYRHADLVIRNFKSALTDAPGILTVPVGYANGTRVGGTLKPPDQRGLAWSFAGEIKASRQDMARAFESFGPNRVMRSGAARISKTEYDDWLEDSVFAPCPMGNVVTETWRLYEALELGAIPIVEDRLTLDYYRALFGPHPIPTFRTWGAARAYCEQLMADKPRLLAKQDELHRWWQAKRAETIRLVRDAVTGPSQHEALQRFAARLRNRVAPLHEAARLAELTRHQSPQSLMRRLSRPLSPLRRILRGTFGRTSA